MPRYGSTCGTEGVTRPDSHEPRPSYVGWRTELIAQTAYGLSASPHEQHVLLAGF